MKKATQSLLIVGTLLGTTAITAAPTLAQDPGFDTGAFEGTIGVGIAVTPRYLGSNKRDTTLEPVADLSWNKQVFFKYDDRAPYRYDQGLGYNFVRTPNLRVAALANYVRGRQESDDRDNLVGTGDIDNAIEIGALVEYGFDYLRFDGGARLDVSDSHNGILLEAGLSAGATFGGNFKLLARGGLQWASQNYNETVWGISASQAALSGGRYVQQSRESGLEQLNFLVSGDYAFSQNFGAIARLTYIRLMGPAETSQLSIKNDQIGFGGYVYYKF